MLHNFPNMDQLRLYAAWVPGAKAEASSSSACRVSEAMLSPMFGDVCLFVFNAEYVQTLREKIKFGTSGHSFAKEKHEDKQPS